MAFIRPGRSSRRRMSLRGSVVLRVWNGRTYAQKWPAPRGQPKRTHQKANLKRMAYWNRAVKQTPGDEQVTMGDALEEFMQKHRGVRGTAAIRLRDWLTQNVSGRAWALQTPDGKTMYSEAVVRDCSDFLDWLEPRLGSLLTRTDEAWLPTVNCRPGNVLCCTTNGDWPNSCPAAEIPPERYAMGGGE